MSDAIITVSNLGKKYRLKHQAEGQHYTALRDVIAGKVKSLFQNRNSQIVNRNSTEDFWALKDVSFEVKRGEVVGIIGRNGAGKSTLLKILSRITEPTTGRVHLKGRVASLLEVGTGFHPELTGRENVFLNGAILGMSRVEIRKKFDEIVAFAEVEKFLDTPVKRYSSGMYVRLAFAVAAHLEPEILIVDEVLAVGDAEFQKKCLGKMQDVASHGRTVLFVSHNMAVIHNLCPRLIVLSNGQIVFAGSSAEGIAHYLAPIKKEKEVSRTPHEDGRPTITHASVELTKNEVFLMLEISSTISCQVSLEIRLLDNLGGPVGFASAGLLDPDQVIRTHAGVTHVHCRFSSAQLAKGNYRLAVAIATPLVSVIDFIEDGLEFYFDRVATNGMQRVLDQGWGYGSFELPMRVDFIKKL
jgi:lipopolysaccharide transport system ATP-binding protein